MRFFGRQEYREKQIIRKNKSVTANLTNVEESIVTAKEQ